MIDFRILIFQQSRTSAPTLAFPVPFPIFTFIPITERQEILPILPIYHKKISTVVGPDSKEIKNGFHPFIGTR